MKRLTDKDRELDYVKLNKLLDQKYYRDVMKKAVDTVKKHLPDLDHADVSISLYYLVDLHGTDALKGVIGVDQYAMDNNDRWIAEGCIIHDLPRPHNIKNDILPKCLNYSKYCTI